MRNEKSHKVKICHPFIEPEDTLVSVQECATDHNPKLMNPAYNHSNIILPLTSRSSKLCPP